MIEKLITVLNKLEVSKFILKFKLNLIEMSG